jgi:hypothetical protein
MLISNDELKHRQPDHSPEVIRNRQLLFKPSPSAASMHLVHPD